MKMHHTPRQHGVLIVDDHDLYRSLAAEVVEATDGFSLIGIARDRQQTLRWMCDYGDEVDLVLMDVNLGPDDGVTLTAEISERSGNLDIVLVTALAIDDLPQAAWSCGARGYLPKAELSPHTLRQASDGVYDWHDG